ncbi:uncharacterized protein MONOS_8484 [Monocercomonoides exilis]|uniref:uncharacterized protein n=1 Tax=Monocercomonoides exilis TaxID=2049356 RepID=UPI0035594D08|nr:hypothetical protein MONOS_8484 [Monocercomonoides exilis]|eukprot:MONOS_8484.1-p1 / transcript=MONOS_8484.1 / gene=MONOS_8484 / organism=Monocercomonoides_exilis_PA203 / gene_product=unspecified product / transcript_product=unspecified product / location=Mono_scaffold00321:4008-4331(+) / protein_length=108 / sequence_SO=supercontig / SO=protein_coding / is_pseudo=false
MSNVYTFPVLLAAYTPSSVAVLSITAAEFTESEKTTNICATSEEHAQFRTPPVPATKTLHLSEAPSFLLIMPSFSSAPSLSAAPSASSFSFSILFIFCCTIASALPP